jgi:hypothetical protein
MKRLASVVVVLGALLVAASVASAQPLGTFRWQLQPYCNVLSLRVEQKGAIYVLEGIDDQCGASQQASVAGVAFLNPSGLIGFGLTTVTAPGATPVHLDVTLSLPSLNGTWVDSAGNAGAFAFTPGPGSPGNPRPVPPRGLPVGSITATHLAAGAVGTAAINAAQVQRRVSACAAASAVRAVNEDGSVVCEATGVFNVFGVPADNFVGVGRNFRISGNEVFGIHSGFGANVYGGMYVETADTGGWPFYGFATNGSFRSWTFFNGTTSNWHVYNTGIKLTATSAGPVVVGNFGNPPNPAPAAQLEVRATGTTDLVRAYADSSLRFRISSVGNVTADGTYTSPAADFAELLPSAAVSGPGDVLVIAADGRLEPSTGPYQAAVAGVHSTKPAFMGGDRPADGGTAPVPLAIIGVVPTKASAENGPIRPGDLLTTSSAPGHAMRCEGVERCFGRTVGKALTGLDAGTGVITVLVMLQ